jgi:hypothetical protein
MARDHDSEIISLERDSLVRNLITHFITQRYLTFCYYICLLKMLTIYVSFPKAAGAYLKAASVKAVGIGF